MRESPQKEMIPPDGDQKIMHASARGGDSELLASDGRCDGTPAQFNGFSLSLGVATVEEGQRLFKALAQGGKVEMPFEPTFWTKGFGMLVDKFGIGWMVNVEHGEH